MVRHLGEVRMNVLYFIATVAIIYGFVWVLQKIVARTNINAKIISLEERNWRVTRSFREFDGYTVVCRKQEIFFKKASPFNFDYEPLELALEYEELYGNDSDEFEAVVLNVEKLNQEIVDKTENLKYILFSSESDEYTALKDEIDSLKEEVEEKQFWIENNGWKI